MKCVERRRRKNQKTRKQMKKKLSLSYQVDRVHHLESAADPLGAALGPRQARGRRIGSRSDGAAAARVPTGVGGAVPICRGAPRRRRRRAAAPDAAAPVRGLPPCQRRRLSRSRSQVRDHLHGDGRAVPDPTVDATVGPLADQKAELDVGERVCGGGLSGGGLRCGGVCRLFSSSVLARSCGGPPGGGGFLSGLLGRDLFYFFGRGKKCEF